MKQNEKTSQLFSRAATYCSTAERCRSEVMAKFQQWDKDHEADSDAVLKRLEQEGFLDEQRYAQAFANDKMRFQGWGRQKIRLQLMQKGITESAILAALGQLDEDVYHQTLQNLADKKRRELRREKDPYMLKQKLSRFLVGRGFSMDDIMSVVR